MNKTYDLNYYLKMKNQIEEKSKMNSERFKDIKDLRVVINKEADSYNKDEKAIFAAEMSAINILDCAKDLNDLIHEIQDKELVATIINHNGKEDLIKVNEAITKLLEELR